MTHGFLIFPSYVYNFWEENNKEWPCDMIRRITPERWSVEQENKRYKETPIKGKLEKER